MDRFTPLSRGRRFCAGASLLCGLAAPGWALTVDTGPGFNQGGGWSLYDDRPETSGYQSLAGLFTVDAAQDTISSVQGWMNWSFGGRMTFSIRSSFQNLPGAVLYSAQLTLPATALNVPDWRGVGGLDWRLTTGDYWLVFEGSLGGGSGAMPPGAAQPLEGYASSPGLMGAEWMRADTLDFGVRINTFPEPPPLPVPEPTTAWLLLGGLGLLAAGIRRRGSAPA